MEKLTQEQLVRIFRRLGKRWPDNVELFVGDGEVCLVRFDKSANEPVKLTPSGEVSREGIIATFPGIRADGGGW